MASRAIRVALLFSILPVAGCGTVANLAEQKPGEGGVSPFGGVRQDLACLEKARTGELGYRTHPRTKSDHYPQRALMLFCAADLPLSLIGDVMTWPYTAAYSYINQPVPTPPVLVADPPLPSPMPIPAQPGAQAPAVLDPSCSENSSVEGALLLR